MVLSGLVVALAPPMAWAAKPSPPVGGSDQCGWRVSREYGPAVMRYRLHLSLAGCDWWDGSARALKVSLVRTESHRRQAAQSDPAPCAGSPGTPGAGCDAAATIEHPEGETAHYRGEATWEWSDGRHRAVFDTTCATTSETVRCADDAGPHQ